MNHRYGYWGRDVDRQVSQLTEKLASERWRASGGHQPDYASAERDASALIVGNLPINRNKHRTIIMTNTSTSSRISKPRVKRIVRTSVAKTRATRSPQDIAANAVSTALAAVSRVVIVNYPNNNQGYAYHTRDESIAVGDYCLVISPYADHNGGSWRFDSLGGYLSIVKVVDMKETTHSINAASKWLMGKVDISQALAEAARQEGISVLKAKIAKARKAAEERVKLEQLRDLSPELNELINQLDALQG